MAGRYLGLKGSALQIAIGVIAGMDFLLFGYDQGVTGGLLSLDSFVAVFPEIATVGPEYKSLSQAAQSQRETDQGGLCLFSTSKTGLKLTVVLGIVVAAYNLGCFVGSIPTIWIGNWLGRRRTIFLGSFIMVIGAILQCTAYHLPQLIVGRIVTGLGT